MTHLRLHIPKHPLLEHKLTLLRNQDTPDHLFRKVCTEMILLMAYEAARELKVQTVTVQTPLEACSGLKVDNSKITLALIMRAAVACSESLLTLFPGANFAHIGVKRHHQTAKPMPYHFSKPRGLDQSQTFVIDPMLGTGGSAKYAIEQLKNAGANDLRFVCLLAAPEGVKLLNASHPDVPIWTAALDRELNAKAYLMPGLGDAGDRIFGTR